MPGLIGFTDKCRQYNKDMLLNMRSLLKHFDSYIDDELFSDKNIYGSRTHLGIINQGKQPYVYNNRFFSWMEGEFYNQKELKSKYNIVSATDNELLINIYNSTRSFEFLRDIDGYYTAVLYDKKENKLYLITDRGGFKPLYWGIINDNLVWSSEVKGFLGHMDFKPVIDRQAGAEFFDIGYLLENRTWFEGIELVPSASVLTFDIQESKAKIQHYWSWSDIKPIKGPIDEREIVEELGRLFKNAVRRRVNNDEKIGITLSGGLDSRALLAAVPEDYSPLHAFTFGKEGCEDIRIASEVSKIKNVEHHIVTLDTRNWLHLRPHGIWVTDGQKNMMHMHAITTFYTVYKKFCNIVLNGFLGGTVLGGTYMGDTKWSVAEKINQRGRRFINERTRLVETVAVSRSPFFDNCLIELVFSIPESMRKDHLIYNKMLLQTFPEYFNNIPWQRTGCPINYPKQLVELTKFKNRVVNKLKRESQRFGFNFKDLNNYTNYPVWIRQEPARSFFQKLLLSKDALYPEYIDKNKIQSYAKEHMMGKTNYHNELCLALTFELWLKQIFEGKYRGAKGKLL